MVTIIFSSHYMVSIIFSSHNMVTIIFSSYYVVTIILSPYHIIPFHADCTSNSVALFQHTLVISQLDILALKSSRCGSCRRTRHCTHCNRIAYHRGGWLRD